MALEDMSAVKKMATNKLCSTVQESLNEILKASFHHVQRRIRLVVYSVVEQVMLDLLRKEVIWETLGVHKAKFIDKDAAVEGFSKRLLACSSLMAPIVRDICST